MRFSLIILGFPKLPIQSLVDYCNSLTILEDTLCEQQKVMLNPGVHFSCIHQYEFYLLILIQNLHLKNHQEASLTIYGEVPQYILVHRMTGSSATVKRG